MLIGNLILIWTLNSWKLEDYVPSFSKNKNMFFPCKYTIQVYNLGIVNCFYQKILKAHILKS